MARNGCVRGGMTFGFGVKGSGMAVACNPDVRCNAWSNTDITYENPELDILSMSPGCSPKHLPPVGFAGVTVSYHGDKHNDSDHNNTSAFVRVVAGTVVPIGDGMNYKATEGVVVVTMVRGGVGTFIAKLRDNVMAVWKTVSVCSLGRPVTVTDTDVVGSLPP